MNRYNMKIISAVNSNRLIQKKTKKKFREQVLFCGI